MFRTVERKEQRDQKKDNPILIVVELMISQGKIVNIPIRLNDDPAVLASNFAKTYNLNPAGQSALQEILQGHIMLTTQAQEVSDTDPFQDSSVLEKFEAKPTTIIEENPASTL